eukprot:TRINITY_DN91_c1_g3_i1.p1 TRINITY_DN91_c1_g3~~TRINITY_DN91_c1_g3_i1.p1  ORF type:complete len:436 (-),score=63.39 TRINITY_DN91_c1_g3_i1:26-1333(-)
MFSNAWRGPTNQPVGQPGAASHSAEVHGGVPFGGPGASNAAAGRFGAPQAPEMLYAPPPAGSNAVDGRLMMDGGGRQQHGGGGGGGGGFRGGNAMHGPGRPGTGRAAAMWDHETWLQRWRAAEAAGPEAGGKEMRQLLREVAKSNYSLVRDGPFARDVSRTNLVTALEARQRLQGSGRDAALTISAMTTGDALLYFAHKDRSSIVCALNFANGEHVGGGYLNGARAQEEELCRQFPSVYTSLSRAKDYGKAYPFGCVAGPGRYSDVLYTDQVVARRDNQRSGYRLLSDHEVVSNISLVSAAAPNLKGGEIWDPEGLKQAVRTIIVTPKLKDPRVQTLVLGAWGCGAFACDPKQMASIFAQVLMADKLNRLYREVHFAIPEFGTDHNAQLWEQTLMACGVPLVRSPGRSPTAGGAPAAAGQGFSPAPAFTVNGRLR